MYATLYRAFEFFFFDEDVLQYKLLSYIKGQPHAYFQEDNARPHVVRRTKECLKINESLELNKTTTFSLNCYFFKS